MKEQKNQEELIKQLKDEIMNLEDENASLESENSDLTRENNKLQSEIDNLNTELSFYCNDKEKIEKLIKDLRFPVMLRKMWSGGEVQEWIDEKVKIYREKK